MASFTPYSFIQCPCYDSATQARTLDDIPSPSSADAPDDDDNAFDPRASRSNYSLYPIEHLLYCVDCNQIRCPRCVSEELVTIYCPSCLFEVGASSIKTEGNRYVTRVHNPNCVSSHLAAYYIAYYHLASILHTDLLLASNEWSLMMTTVDVRVAVSNVLFASGPSPSSPSNLPRRIRISQQTTPRRLLRALGSCAAPTATGVRLKLASSLTSHRGSLHSFPNCGMAV